MRLSIAGCSAALAVVFAVAVSPADAQTVAALRCSSRKVKSVGREADAKLKCHAAAARRGDTVDAACLDAAIAKQQKSFLGAEGRGGCVTTDDSDELSARTDAFVSDTTAMLLPGTTADSRRCAYKKQRAAGKESRALLMCAARAALAGEVSDAACVAKAHTIFDERFVKAEAAGGCGTTGDDGSIEALVNAHVNDAIAALLAICGDAIAGPGEPCDGVSDATCPGHCIASCICGGECGNGVTEEPGEECDDGNVVSDDGCSSLCQMENPAAACAGVPTSAGTALGVELIAAGLDSPVHVTAPRLDPRRVFIVEQAGRVLLVRDGALQATPFLDITGRVLAGGERGLLSVAFDPDYEHNGRVFVNYTRKPDGNTVIARFDALSEDLADAASEKVLFTVAQPFSNHNGGQIAFGADGYLYVGMGDGGGAGDPEEAGQDDTHVLAKILRADVNVTSAPYWTVPADNPNPGALGTLALIWAKGLRNPWRFSFDRATDDLYIGDVGQNSIEEIDYAAAPRGGGVNYGWDIFEGSSCYEPAPDPVCPSPPTGFTFPVHEYSHAQGCSVTGGFVYRGCALPDLHGTYFYSDYCSGWIRTFEVTGGAAMSHADRTPELVAGGFSVGNTSSFGEDARGEIYIVDLGGSVWKLVPGS